MDANIGSHIAAALGVRQRADADAGAAVAGDSREVEAVCLTDPGRLGDGQRPLDELSLGAQQIDLDLLPGRGPQREQQLESGNAAAGDQNAGVALAHRAARTAQRRARGCGWKDSCSSK